MLAFALYTLLFLIKLTLCQRPYRNLTQRADNSTWHIGFLTSGNSYKMGAIGFDLRQVHADGNLTVYKCITDWEGVEWYNAWERVGPATEWVQCLNGNVAWRVQPNSYLSPTDFVIEIIQFGYQGSSNRTASSNEYLTQDYLIQETSVHFSDQQTANSSAGGYAPVFVTMDCIWRADVNATYNCDAYNLTQVPLPFINVRRFQPLSVGNLTISITNQTEGNTTSPWLWDAGLTLYDNNENDEEYIDGVGEGRKPLQTTCALQWSNGTRQPSMANPSDCDDNLSSFRVHQADFQDIESNLTLQTQHQIYVSGNPGEYLTPINTTIWLWGQATFNGSPNGCVLPKCTWGLGQNITMPLRVVVSMETFSLRRCWTMPQPLECPDLRPQQIDYLTGPAGIEEATEWAGSSYSQKNASRTTRKFRQLRRV